ncbi:MAG: phosphotyrosine protein phosphatase [Ignavibacteriales bacterium CG12_big_fil_rev_8_21_14_0_65_30_8]|nr:MAG: phosphotyrosine protein phosphatase [Ignavibacteriales bacterium CG12_big_fil_rev_8_21_14_0_65_30_8]
MKNTKILFVCLGNICRSPAAEAIMTKKINDAGLQWNISVDSAGVMGYHTGEQADMRMKQHANLRGYEITSIARRFNPEKDFNDFDFIITMDNENYSDINAKDIEGKYYNKIHKMVEFCATNKVDEVPDPYYGGKEGFEKVLDILEDGCEGLLKKINDGTE